MNTVHRSLLVSLIAHFLVVASNAYGWGAYAHYWVGNQVGLGNRANLPDYWGESDISRRRTERSSPSNSRCEIAIIAGPDDLSFARSPSGPGSMSLAGPSR